MTTFSTNFVSPISSEDAQQQQHLKEFFTSGIDFYKPKIWKKIARITPAYFVAMNKSSKVLSPQEQVIYTRYVRAKKLENSLYAVGLLSVPFTPNYFLSTSASADGIATPNSGENKKHEVDIQKLLTTTGKEGRDIQRLFKNALVGMPNKTPQLMEAEDALEAFSLCEIGGNSPILINPRECLVSLDLLLNNEREFFQIGNLSDDAVFFSFQERYYPTDKTRKVKSEDELNTFWMPILKICKNGPADGMALIKYFNESIRSVEERNPYIFRQAKIDLDQALDADLADDKWWPDLKKQMPALLKPWETLIAGLIPEPVPDHLDNEALQKDDQVCNSEEMGDKATKKNDHASPEAKRAFALNASLTAEEIVARATLEYPTTEMAKLWMQAAINAAQGTPPDNPDNFIYKIVKFMSFHDLELHTPHGRGKLKVAHSGTNGQGIIQISIKGQGRGGFPTSKITVVSEKRDTRHKHINTKDL